ncbi:uncharacterized protein LOC131670945 [Phymastichus coffea]|uniref:uncharacterized protein LOC131670945 n=1 Tax=Phymastichus coffea TaxID=108790 RepID=UPI00273A981E|nr:uncharacterized protein LOC131670945 [Phymastichus coffea]
MSELGARRAIRISARDCSARPITARGFSCSARLASFLSSSARQCSRATQSGRKDTPTSRREPLARPDRPSPPRRLTSARRRFSGASSLDRSSLWTPNETLTLTTDYDCISRLDQPSPAIVLERATGRPTRRGLLRRWMPPCCRRSARVSAIDEAYRLAPPTYSAVGFLEQPNAPQRPPSSHLAVLLRNDEPTSSFVARTPPPSYAQAQGIAYSLERLISSPASNTRMWSASPTSAVCPRCASLVYTVVEARRDAVAHATALALCLIG